MVGKHRIVIAAAAILLLGTADRLNAAPAPGTPINLALPYPSKAPLVVQINGLQRIKGRLAKMLEALPAAERKKLQHEIDDGLEDLLEDRKLDALPKDGRILVVLHDIAKLIEGEKAVSVLLPVTSYKDFKNSLLTADERKSIEKAGAGIESFKSGAIGDDVRLFMVELKGKGYVALTPSKDTAEMYAGKYKPAQTGAMGPELSASFCSSDIALYINMDVINDLYGDQIRQFKGLIDFALGQAQNMGMIPGLGKQQIEMLKTVLNGFVQGVEDSKGVVLAAELRPEGFNFRAQVRFASETQSADLLKSELPTSLAGLAKMPKGLNSYGATKFGKSLAKLGKKFTQEFGAADGDEKEIERIGKLMDEISSAGPQGEFTASSTPDVSFSVTAYKDANKAATALVRLYSGMPAGGKVSTIVLKGKPKVTEKAATEQGFTFAQVNLSFDFEASVAALPEQAREIALAQFKKLMKEKSSVWIGSNGNLLLQVMAKDWNAAKKLVGEYLAGKPAVGDSEGFQLTRKNLPANDSLLYLLETGQTISMMVDQIKTVGSSIPGGLGVPQLGSVKPAKGAPTYIGVALALKPQVATFNLFVPGTSMNVAVKMLTPLLRKVE